MEPPPSSRAEEPPSWDELYKINLMPSELFLKFRKELQGLRVGVNLEVIFSLSLSLSLQFAELQVKLSSRFVREFLKIYYG